MAIFRCKMCGGDLEIAEGQSVCTCEFCGTEQTLPRLDSDRKANLYDRANHFRRNNDFDKAMGIYEQILNEDNTDAEAYWSLVLCRYGIEYVEDPSTHKRIPTINRAQYTSIYADENYKAALEHAAVAQKIVYEQEAKTIDEIQKGILAISEKEEPFDVFICYKESDETGRRTPDSVLANDLYHQLTQEGFKVFFARITLEDKLGQEYEPYIFAALNSAKVMVVLGTKQEYFNAVWVKNEWSRFLSLVKESNGGKYLIPAYRDMDPYDLPDEFSHLQAQDMSKLGFMQDLIRGINKIIDVNSVAKSTEHTSESNVVSPQIDSLLERAGIFLEDGDYSKAAEYADRILDSQPQNAKAYLILLLSKYKVSSIEELSTKEITNLEDDRDYQRILKYGDSSLISKLIECADIIKSAITREHNMKIYVQATTLLKNDDCESLLKAEELFCSISDYRDSTEKALQCKRRYDEIIYVQATTLLKNDDCESLLKAEELFCSISDYRDSTEKALQCKRRHDEIIIELQAINESILNEVLEKKNGLLKKIDELKGQIGAIDNKIIKLNAEKETLTGFFAAGKRKEIERTIDSLARDKSAMNASISEIKSDVQKTDAQYMELKNQADLGVDLTKEGSVKIAVGGACKVFKIIAQKGSRVREGDTVIVVEVVEPFKIEIPIVAPTDGVVSTINVSVGESIDDGFVVATMNK